MQNVIKYQILAGGIVWGSSYCNNFQSESVIHDKAILILTDVRLIFLTLSTVSTFRSVTKKSQQSVERNQVPHWSKLQRLTVPHSRFKTYCKVLNKKPYNGSKCTGLRLEAILKKLVTSLPTCTWYFYLYHDRQYIS